LGTTLIVAATADGGFKCLLLEGKGTITLPNGKTRRLEAGDMAYVPPGAQDFRTVVKIDLGKLVEGSQLVTGFSSPLPTLGEVQNEITKQRIAIISGTYEETGLLIGGVGTFKNDPEPLDSKLRRVTTPVFARSPQGKDVIASGPGAGRN
jgi:hypothetical protein